MASNSKLSQLDPAAKADIEELQQKILLFKKGEIIEDKFKHFRLTRGVYGQRQTGVHMFRTKIPYGKLTAQQLIRLADVSEKYTNGNLHLTTRQNIQMHYVKLDDATAIWQDLAEAGVTAREACGNTVRNLTASAKAGIDPDEPFDVSPYVQAMYEYFLRNPICQEMGRKIKPAFSSSTKDSAFTYFHDFGFIPKVQNVDGQAIKGFKVVVGGGLGAQSIIAQTAYDFLPTDEIIPFVEASIRVFDRYGERAKRLKARMKFLIKKLGFDAFLQLVQAERTAIKNKKYPIDVKQQKVQTPQLQKDFKSANIANPFKYQLWLNTNTFEQKQAGFYGVFIKVPLGNINAETARQLAQLVRTYAADDIRITVNQGFLLRYVRPQFLPNLYQGLKQLNLAGAGFDKTNDITACPGTDTCNLAVTDSTNIALELEDLIESEYPDLQYEQNLKIKISGCMNSCGQHMAAQIGLHGSSIKVNQRILPALQIVLGGGVSPSGQGFIAERVIKLPTRRIPAAIRLLLDDYLENQTEKELFNQYFQRQGKKYFYDLLKHLADKSTLTDIDFVDWGSDDNYHQAIGVGECAGVSYDMVSAIISEAEEKVSLAEESLETAHPADSIYHSYAALVIGAKALLLADDVKCNTHKGIINDFESHFEQSWIGEKYAPFGQTVLQINKNEPSESFAKTYYKQAMSFVQDVKIYRQLQLSNQHTETPVVAQYYKA